MNYDEKQFLETFNKLVERVDTLTEHTDRIASALEKFNEAAISANGDLYIEIDQVAH